MHDPIDLTTDPLRVAIVGTGNIGTDLLLKVIASPFLRCDLFAGRRQESPGIRLAQDKHVPTSTAGVDAVAEMAGEIDLVFDATSAQDATHHWSILGPLGMSFVDLTPANLGTFCVPALNLDSCLNEQYVGMVTCGGQAAVPIAQCIADATEGLEYVEIVSASSSASVGAASRANLDEYVMTTEKATSELCKVDRTKTILIINPAEPGIVMRNSIVARSTERVDMPKLQQLVSAMEKSISSYVPGYRVVVPPTVTGGAVMVTVEVEGRGDWLPRYAGNLDVITCAAVAVAEARAGGI